jgi:hypothetical protein
MQALPTFSILIGRVSTEDGDRILETLDALRHQDCELTREVVVVDRLDDAISAAIRTRFPEVVLQLCPSRATLPEMRAQALAASHGRLILVTEDHCVPPLSWLRDFNTLHEEYPEAAAIAGSVENGVTGRALDWATYLCEYAAFAPPIDEAPGAGLAGMNVLYQRSVLESCAPETLTRGFWETTVHPQLAEQGRLLVATNRVRILHCKKFSFRLFAAQRFAYSRYHAGIRFPREKRLMRWLAALATPVLPVLLTVRLVRAARRKASIARPTLAAIPYLFTFFGIWACGEIVGYLSGPGDSLQTIE